MTLFPKGSGLVLVVQVAKFRRADSATRTTFSRGAAVTRSTKAAIALSLEKCVRTAADVLQSYVSVHMQKQSS